MKRLLAGGLALGLTTVGSLALAGPAGAQEESPTEDVQLDATLSADLLAPGEEATATAVDPCTVPEEGDPGELWWMAWAFAEDARAPEFEGHEPLEADGTWSVTFQAPSAPGDYEFFAVCTPGDLPQDEVDELQTLGAQAATTLGDEGDGQTLPDEPGDGEVGDDGGDGGGDGGDESPLRFEFYDLTFTVDGGDGPAVTEPPAPSPAPPVAAPAQPVAGEPDFTG